MTRRFKTQLCAASTTLILTASALAQGTVTIDLSSPSNGAIVPAGSTIDWTITATVSSGDNLGLALVVVDLVQGEGNPELFDLPPGNAAPVGMADFDRPAGISNPGPGGVGSGYGGTQLGTPGSLNLAQIGGSQNTFGVAGAAIGQDVNVDGGVGQGLGGQVVCTGSFIAPATPGAYSFSLDKPIANTLKTINAAPFHSSVYEALAATTNPSISFTICLAGDADGSFTLDPTLDIPAFVNEVLNGGGDEYTTCASDVNGDGEVDGLDIGPFAAAFLASP